MFIQIHNSFSNTHKMKTTLPIYRKYLFSSNFPQRISPTLVTSKTLITQRKKPNTLFTTHVTQNTDHQLKAYVTVTDDLPITKEEPRMAERFQLGNH